MRTIQWTQLFLGIIAQVGVHREMWDAIPVELHRKICAIKLNLRVRIQYYAMRIYIYIYPYMSIYINIYAEK